MKITPHNKDHIARLIAEKAYALPAGTDSDDAMFANMLRLSEALLSVGEVGSSFRKLTDLRTKRIPTGEETDSDVTYLQVLQQVLPMIEKAA